MKLLICFLAAVFFLYNTYQLKQAYQFRYTSGSMSGTFKVLSNCGQANTYDKYLVKNLSGDKMILYVKKGRMILRAQNEVWVQGNFLLPDAARNTGAFDYQRYLNSQKIFGMLFAEKIVIERENKEDMITKARYHIHQIFAKMLPSRYASVIETMLTGNQEGIPKEIKQDFKNSGIMHVLAVSGAHVSYIVLFLGVFFNRIFGKYVSQYFSMIGILLYILIAGASPSVVRAGSMAILNIVAFMISQKPNSFHHLIISGTIILLLHPYTIFDIGFILSFLGTLGIILFSRTLNLFFARWVKVLFLRNSLTISVAAQLMILPVTAFYFHFISLISIVSNLFIVPVTGLLILLAIISTITGFFSIKIAHLFSYALYLLLHYMIEMASLLGSVPYANLLVITPKKRVFFCYYSMLYVLFSERFKNKDVKLFRVKIHMKKMILFLIGLWITGNFIYERLPKNEVLLNMIDVGQGDSFYIETTKGKVILIDTGGDELSDRDIGEEVLLPYLLYHGKKKIDFIFISHPHQDHIGGVYTLIEKLDVHHVIIGKHLENEELIQKLYEVCKKRNTKVVQVKKGDVIKIDDIEFRILFPDAQYTSTNLNNVSLVIHMIYGKISALFTGDLEDELESLGRFGVDVDILKVGHHGSDTSTSETLLRKTSPKISLISVGKNNRYGHPKESILARLNRFGVSIYRTDRMGEVMLRFNKNGEIKMNSIY